MRYRPLGRTGERASVLSLGTGGPSRLGQTRNASFAQSQRLISFALDSGINLVDTSPRYLHSESILGRCLTGRPRDQYLLSTKVPVREDGELVRAASVRTSLEASLRALRTDYVDVLHLHGVLPEEYPYAREELVPVLATLRDEGLTRFIGITEIPRRDTRHVMLQAALADEAFDIVMVGYNLLSPVARATVLPTARRLGVGVIAMIPVRRSLVQPELLEQRIREAKTGGLIPVDALPNTGPLDWLVDEGSATSLAAAGYKFSIDDPGVSTVLTGTGDIDHLAENLRAVLGPPIRADHRERLAAIFGDVDEPLFA